MKTIFRNYCWKYHEIIYRTLCDLDCIILWSKLNYLIHRECSKYMNLPQSMYWISWKSEQILFMTILNNGYLLCVSGCVQDFRICQIYLYVRTFYCPADLLCIGFLLSNKVLAKFLQNYFKRSSPSKSHHLLHQTCILRFEKIPHP